MALLSAKLDLVSPLKVLSRGYSLVTKNGETVKSSKKLSSGDNVEITFSDGRLNAEIK